MIFILSISLILGGASGLLLSLIAGPLARKTKFGKVVVSWRESVLGGFPSSVHSLLQFTIGLVVMFSVPAVPFAISGDILSDYQAGHAGLAIIFSFAGKSVCDRLI